MRTSEAQLYLCSLFSVYPTGDSMIGLIDWLCPTGLFSKIPNYHVWSNISWTWGRYWSEGNNFFFFKPKKIVGFVLFCRSYLNLSMSLRSWNAPFSIVEIRLSSKCKILSFFNPPKSPRRITVKLFPWKKRAKTRIWEQKAQNEYQNSIQFSLQFSSVQFAVQYSSMNGFAKKW